MVDVGVDSKKQVLDHEPHPGRRRVQRQLPSPWKGRSIPLVMSQERFTVEIGKCHILSLKVGPSPYRRSLMPTLEEQAREQSDVRHQPKTI